MPSELSALLTFPRLLPVHQQLPASVPEYIDPREGASQAGDGVDEYVELLSAYVVHKKLIYGEASWIFIRLVAVPSISQGRERGAMRSRPTQEGMYRDVHI